VLTDDTLLNLDHLNNLIAVDLNRKLVTVQAGIRIKDLNELLPRYDLAMANLGSISEQSIAGAISTGTHGTGLRSGNLATQIVGMHLVTSEGRLLKLTVDQDYELMMAARVSLGALGVITQVTIRCVDAFNLRLYAEPRPFDEVLDQIDTLNQQNEKVRLYWFANTDEIYVMTLNRTHRSITRTSPIIERVNNRLLRHDVMALLLRAGYQLPDIVDNINRFAAIVGWDKEDRVDRSDHLLNVPMPPKHSECEYAVPIDQAVEAIRATRQMIKDNHYHVNWPVEIRFVAADESMLSPSYRRHVCYIGAYTYGEHFAGPYFAGFEHLMKSFRGRPHWGKHHTLTAYETRKLYPRYDRFNQIRKQLDPSGTFANAYVRHLFE
jgi:FAD/FMN-containing dehydrogenase